MHGKDYVCRQRRGGGLCTGKFCALTNSAYGFIIIAGDMMKKTAFFMALVLLIFVFAACGEGFGGDIHSNITHENELEDITNVSEELPPSNGAHGEDFAPIEDPAAQVPSSPAVALETMIKAKTSVNVRSGAGVSYKSVGKLDKNDMLVYLGTKSGWYITAFKGKTAYVSANSMYTSLVSFEKSPSAIVENIIGVGYFQLGYPYVWGSERYHWGNGVLNKNFVEGRFDCSALVQYMFFVGADIILGLTTREQVKQGVSVAKSDIKRGDLLFFTNSSRYYNTGIERVGHVALYLGQNYILHTASDHAVIEPISSLRWDYYITARRFV